MSGRSLALALVIGIGSFSVAGSAGAQQRLSSLSTSQAALDPAAFRDVPQPPTKPLLDEFSGPRLTLGVRAGYLGGEGKLIAFKSATSYGAVTGWNDWTASGSALAADIGVRLSPAWTLFGAYEHGALSTAKWGDSATMTSHAMALGLRATTNRRARVGFITELGAGYRFLVIDQQLRSVASGLEPLRVSMGLSILASPRLRVQALVGISVGQFTTADISGPDCANTDPTRCNDVAPDDREWHIFRSLSVAGTFEL